MVSTSQPVRILIIDDDEDDREIFGIALEDAASGFECITAKNGLEAWGLYKVVGGAKRPGFLNILIM